MAAEKVNTRQKMINMMYLVFIAMLALNISKEVLGTLGILSEDMEKSTAELKSSIDDLYTTIDLNSNQDYYKIPSEELPKLRDLTDDYWSYIQMLKDSLISLDKNNYLTNVSVKNEDGEKTHIADDTWRTAGTSQKVASGFGQDMKDCVGSKVDADREGI